MGMFVLSVNLISHLLNIETIENPEQQENVAGRDKPKAPESVASVTSNPRVVMVPANGKVDGKFNFSLVVRKFNEHGKMKYEMKLAGAGDIQTSGALLNGFSNEFCDDITDEPLIKEGEPKKNDGNNGNDGGDDGNGNGNGNGDNNGDDNVGDNANADNGNGKNVEPENGDNVQEEDKAKETTELPKDTTAENPKDNQAKEQANGPAADSTEPTEEDKKDE